MHVGLRADEVSVLENVQERQQQQYIQEFRVLKCSGDNPVAPPENPGDPCEEYTSPEKLVNGLWATILALGTVATSMLIITARSWRFFKVPGLFYMLPIVYNRSTYCYINFQARQRSVKEGNRHYPKDCRIMAYLLNPCYILAMYW